MTYRKWTPEDQEFIKNNFGLMSDDELALRLSQQTNSNVSVSMIRTQRRKLGIKKKQGRLCRKERSIVDGANFSNNDSSY
jgi:hypothetical protein